MSTADDNNGFSDVEDFVLTDDYKRDAKRLGSMLEKNSEIKAEDRRYSELEVYSGAEIQRKTGYSRRKINQLRDFAAYSTDLVGFEVDWEME